MLTVPTRRIAFARLARFIYSVYLRQLVDLSGTIFSFITRSFPERDKLCNDHDSMVIFCSVCRVIKRYEERYKEPIKYKRMRD